MITSHDLPGFCSLALLSWVLTRIFARFGGISLDRPNARSSHQKAIPRGAGVVIGLLALVGFVVISFWNSTFALFESHYTVLVVGLFAFSILATGFFEDKINLSIKLRATLECLFIGIFLTALMILNDRNLSPALLVLAVLLSFGYMNFNNFMDGVNGIASLQAIVAGAFYWLAGQALNSQIMADFNMVLVAVLIGFLPNNFPRARIFLGDSGSLFLGSCAIINIAFLSLYDWKTLIWGGLPLLPFLADPSITLVKRLRRGENITQPHRSHYYQRFFDLTGASHKASSFLFAGLTAILATGSYLGLFMQQTIGIVVSASSAIVMFFCFLAIDIARHRSSGKLNQLERNVQPGL